jgi:hypothetical protein
MEGTGPYQSRHHAAIAGLAAVRQHFADDVLCALDHFLRRAARKGEHQNARRVRAVEHQVGGTVSQSVCLPRSRAGQDQQRSRSDALVWDCRTEHCGTALTGIQHVERVWLSFHHNDSILYGYPDSDATQHKLHGASR